MKEILVFTTTLSLGGITSYVINFVNELSKNYKVTLAYTRDDASKLSEISDSVETISYLGPSMKKTLVIMFKHGWLYHALRVKLRNHNKISPMDSMQRVAYAQAEGVMLPEPLKRHYDIAISTAEFFCNNVVAQKTSAKKKIAWIHPDYKALDLDVAFDRKTLDCFDYIATVSKSTRESLIEEIPDYYSKVVYVPNLLDIGRILKLSEEYPVEYEKYKDKKKIITVCRIDNSSKRIDRIIQIAKQMVFRGECFHWFIVGDGPDFNLINSLIQENDICEYVSMIGARHNPYPYIRHADLFVLTSQYEGKPIVVDEALILDCPVIVTNYASSREQIDRSFGRIISNDDKTIVGDFIENLNWQNIEQMKLYLLNSNYYEKIRADFYQGITRILGDET